MVSNEKMSKEVMDRVLMLMRLALEYNNTITLREETDNKPAFFVWFNGHTCTLDVAAHTEGYDKDSDHINEIIRLTPRYGYTEEQILSTLETWIHLFTSLYSDWVTLNHPTAI